MGKGIVDTEIPCGYKQHIELHGFGVNMTGNEDMRICPLHGKKCSRKI
jgi:hypothetical protein